MTNSRQRQPHAPRSPFRWFGGKFQLASRLVKLFPPHQTYCEVFGGACHVLFRKQPVPVETINDINGELINCFRVIQSPAGLSYLAGQLEWALYSRAEFNRFRAQDPATLTEHERAWRFLYLNRCCFGGKNLHNPASLSFGIQSHPRSTQAHALANLLPRLRAAHSRVAAVQIECLAWERCLELYDRPHTFFYLDPPYYGYEQAYGKTFSGSEYERLATCLAGIRGKFLLSINDCPEARHTFRNFNLPLTPEVTYTANRDRGRHAGELVFANYDVHRAQA